METTLWWKWSFHGGDLKIEKLDSKIDAYAASIESKLSGIYNFLSKEKFGNLDADRSPLLPNPATDAKSSEAKSLVGENSSVSEKWPKWGRQSHTYHWSYPKLELQSFSGENPREWLRKCNKFFEIHHCEESEKMEAVDLYLDGKADVWYQSFRLIKGPGRNFQKRCWGGLVIGWEEMKLRNLINSNKRGPSKIIRRSSKNWKLSYCTAILDSWALFCFQFYQRP